MSERCETGKTTPGKANATDKFNSIVRHNQRHCLFENVATTDQDILSAIFNSLLDKGQSFDRQCYIQVNLHAFREGLKRSMKDLRAWKSGYDQAFITQDYSGFATYCVRFSGLLPIVACGAFHPEYDLNGNHLQIITRGSGAFEHVSFNLTSISGKSVLVLGWTGESGGPGESFVESFRLLENGRQANAAFYVALEHLENIYLQPSWWDSRPNHIRSELIGRMRSGTGIGGVERTSNSLSKFPSVLSDLAVEEELRLCQSRHST